MNKMTIIEGARRNLELREAGHKVEPEKRITVKYLAATGIDEGLLKLPLHFEHFVHSVKNLSPLSVANAPNSRF